MAKQDELVYSVSLEWSKQAFSGLNASIEKSIKAFSIATAAVTAASAAIFSLGKNYAQTTDSLIKTSQRINATTQDIQKLTFAAEDNGATMGDVTSSLESLAKAKENMLRGSGDFEAWGQLGVNPTEYSNTADLLRDIADRVKDLDSQRAIDLMGRVGISSNMLQTLQQGKDGLRALGAEAESLGIISTGKMLKSSQAFMSGWQRASSRVSGILNQVSAKLLDTTINPAIEAFNKFMSKNMVQISSILSKIIGYLVKAAEAIVAVFHTVYIQFERLSNMLGGFEEAIKFLGAVFIALRAKVILAMLPAILMVGALYLAFDEVMSFLEGKESYIGDFFDAIGIGADKAREYIKSMGNPLDLVIKLLKTSIEGWKNLFQWVGYGIDKAMEKWKQFMKWIQDTIQMFKDLGNTISDALTFTIPDLTGGLFDSTMDMLGFGVQPQAVAQTTNNSQIAININGSGDPIAVGQEVKRVLNEEMNKSAQRGGF